MKSLHESFFAFSCAISSDRGSLVYCRRSLRALRNLQPEIEPHANDLYFNNISFSFTLSSFLLQLFKLNCNCFPLNAVERLRLDVVERSCRAYSNSIRAE